jgi:hypothetical protein
MNTQRSSPDAMSGGAHTEPPVGPRILVVDNEPDLLATCARLLARYRDLVMPSGSR